MSVASIIIMQTFIFLAFLAIGILIGKKEGMQPKQIIYLLPLLFVAGAIASVVENSLAINYIELFSITYGLLLGTTITEKEGKQ